MQLLHESHFWKALQPLSKVTVNHLFARFVAEKQVKGTIYIDEPENPTAFYIVHPYGMSLLFGDTGHDDFNTKVKDYMLNVNGERTRVEWLQAFPDEWNKTIVSLLGDDLIKTGQGADPEHKVVEENTRANFEFNSTKYLAFRESLGCNPYPIVKATVEIYEQMQGAVVPMHFWNNAAAFYEKGAGFSMVIDGQPVCTAYSAYIFEGLLELGIETLPQYRGKGYALFACAALIDFCLENNFTPVWSCRFENTASYNLAQKLGFEPTITLPYYKLPV